MFQSYKIKFFINRSTGNLSSWDLVPNIYSRERDCTHLRSAEYINKEGGKKFRPPDSTSLNQWERNAEMIRRPFLIPQYWVTDYKGFPVFFQRNILKTVCSEKPTKADFSFPGIKHWLAPYKNSKNLHLIFLSFYIYCITCCWLFFGFFSHMRKGYTEHTVALIFLQWLIKRNKYSIHSGNICICQSHSSTCYILICSNRS